MLCRICCTSVPAYPKTTPADTIHWMPLFPKISVNVAWNNVSITKRKILRADGPGKPAQLLASLSILPRLLCSANLESWSSPNPQPIAIPRINPPPGRMNIRVSITLSPFSSRVFVFCRRGMSYCKAKHPTARHRCRQKLYHDNLRTTLFILIKFEKYFINIKRIWEIVKFFFENNAVELDNNETRRYQTSIPAGFVVWMKPRSSYVILWTQAAAVGKHGHSTTPFQPSP